jgi:hypothetical protein
VGLGRQARHDLIWFQIDRFRLGEGYVASAWQKCPPRRQAVEVYSF